MRANLENLVQHDLSDDCPVCRAQHLTESTLLPATAAWEMQNELPQYSLALHGAAGLLGAMLQEGYSREEIMEALHLALDDIEQHLPGEDALGGPPQGNA